MAEVVPARHTVGALRPGPGRRHAVGVLAQAPPRYPIDIPKISAILLSRKYATASSLKRGKQMEQKIEEKRRFPRIRLKAPLRYQIRGKHEFDNSLTDDISLGGISFTNEEYIPPATNLMMEISIFSRLLDPIGKVAWINPIAHSNRYRLGIEFVELDEQKKKLLSQFIDFKKEGF